MEKNTQENIKKLIENLKLIGFNLEEDNLIIKNSIQGQRFKNYLSAMVNKIKINGNAEDAEIEDIAPEDLKRVGEMHTLLASAKKRVNNKDMVSLSLMLNNLNPKIEELRSKKQTFETKTNLLLNSLELALIKLNLAKLQIEEQKPFLKNENEEVKLSAQKEIENNEKKMVLYQNESDDFESALQSHYMSMMNLSYIAEAKAKKYTVNFEENLNKANEESIEYYKVFTKIFDLEPENYKEFMDEEKTGEGHFKLNIEKQKNVLDKLDLEDMKNIIESIYNINSNYLARDFFIDQIKPVEG